MPIAIWFFLFASVASALPGGVYQGKLGKHLGVIVWFSVKGTVLSGKYFYPNKGADIALEGSFAPAGTFHLTERSPGGAATGSWKGAVTGSQMKGTWFSPDRKSSLSFLLNHLPKAGEKQFMALHPAKVAPTKVGDYSFSWKNVAKLGASIPQLVDYPDQKIQESVNRDLVTHAGTLGCATAKEVWETGIDVRLAAKQLLSVAFELQFSCKGTAHPEHVSAPLNFDLKTGKRIAFEDLFAKGKESRKRFLDVLSPLYEAQAEEEHKNGGWDTADCAIEPENDGEEAQIPKLLFHLEPGYLVVIPQFAHAMQVCEIPTRIPVEKLKKLSKADSVLLRI